MGAIVCHELPEAGTEIPRHVSILPGPWPPQGGYLGAKYNAFKTYDPRNGIPDTKRRVPEDRFNRRLEDVEVVDRQFAKGRLRNVEQSRTLHRTTMDKAIRMMSSEQLKAFDVDEEPERTHADFGDTEFGRGCLAALRLMEVGVRCVEVTLRGWDSHLNNHEVQADRVKVLDPALAALIRNLRERELFERTIVICGGEFGRTPRINPAGGRDHWPHGFSIALAGGGIRGGQTVGATDPDGSKEVADPVQVAAIHATILHALGIDFRRELQTPVGRPMKLSDGRPLRQLL
jgi:uncharacterized protein (DUF1501 family)